MDDQDPRGRRTRRLVDRPSRVGVDGFARPVDPSSSLPEFLDRLPDFLAVRELRGLAAAVAEARQAGRPVVWASGGHLVKVGTGPAVIRLMRRGLVTALALNGAAAIHDWEIAAVGATSEDVARGLEDGTFGMAEETGRELNAAACAAYEEGAGFGAVLGRRMLAAGLPHNERSLIAEATRLGLQVSIHVAIGADTVHQHPSADGAAIGAASMHDFGRLVELLRGMDRGVWINCGSAVQLPEVFLKALAIARNTGAPVRPLTTANLDMLRHYRTERNVLDRPTRDGGRSFELIGHHEINVPLLAVAIELEASRRREAEG